MDTTSLDSEMNAFIARYLEVSGLSTATSVTQQRIDYEAMVRQFSYPHPRGVQTRDSTVNGRHGEIPLRHYRYKAGNERAVILFLHGGGFILGSLDSHDDICAELCAGTGYDLVSVDYRLSPEHYHPVHLDDVEDAFLACQHDSIIAVGASAGATLAAALGHRCQSAARKPAGQVLIYPSLGGDQFELDSYRDNAEAPLLSTADILFYRGIRCADGNPPLQDAEFYPLVATDFSACPATIAFSADVDPLRDDARLYVEKLQAAGVTASWINETGLVHDYLRARHVSRRAMAAFERICDATRNLAEQGTD
jgi:acetyl esterase